MKTIKSICAWIKNAKVARGVLIGSIVIVGVIYLGRYLLAFLLGFGIVAFLLLASLLYNPTQDVTSPASQDLARSVLSDCNLWGGSLKKVHHGYKTMPSFHGDHLGAYAFEISFLNVYTLTPERGWTRGDQVSGELENAVWNAIHWTKKENLEWFPEEREVKSSGIFVRSLPWESLTFPLVFVRPSDKMVFYVYCKT